MVRSSFLVFLAVLAGLSCTRFEQRNVRYDTVACPICSHITHGECPYCKGSGKCMYCRGQKDRLTVSPNILEDTSIKPFSYKEPCPFCKHTGVCPYCNGKGKCWACNGTRKVDDTWECLKLKTPAMAEAAK